MATVINTKRPTDAADRILGYIIAPELYTEYLGIKAKYGRIEEVRCRLGKNAYVSVQGKNIRLEYVTTRFAMEKMIDRICEGSLYAHKETIVEGYVTLDGGVRVGICGRAATENGRIIGVYGVSALNFRIPSPIAVINEPISGLLDGYGGVLVYSPPGEGKTTLLRSVASKAASGDLPRRVCVIDTREELGAYMDDACCVDVLSGYPRGKGIEIAVRTMNPQLIVCDEIGDEREAEMIISATNAGVPFLASAHGDSLKSLLRRTGIKRLHEAGVFDYYVGIRRQGSRLDFCVTKRSDACG